MATRPRGVEARERGASSSRTGGGLEGEDGWSVQRFAIGGYQVVCASGELDLRCNHTLNHELQAALAVPGTPILVDLADVRFIDCGALGVLVAAGERAQAEHRSLTLVRQSRAVRKLVELTGTVEFFASLEQRRGE